MSEEKQRRRDEENLRVLALATLGGFNLDAYVLLPFLRYALHDVLERSLLQRRMIFHEPKTLDAPLALVRAHAIKAFFCDVGRVRGGDLNRFHFA